MEDFDFLFSCANPNLGKFWLTSYRAKCSCPIRWQLSFDRQYLWKESNDILDYLHGESHYKNLTTDTITCGWVWLGRLSHAQIRLDLPGYL